MKVNGFFFLVMGVVSLLGCSIIDEYSKTMPSRRFMDQAISGGIFEISISNLALQKATDGEVKAFAETMISEHTKSNNELKVIASRKEIALPDTMDINKQSTYLSLSQEPGVVFDKKYIDEMVSSHSIMLDKFDSASKFADDGDIRNWASQQIPGLKSHLERAKELDIKTNNL